ncbi:MAG: hypothetical protein KKI09_05015 [Spirochaetes bacterium]|nr:hypothetical protein [Spirochaetota bacterium]
MKKFPAGSIVLAASEEDRNNGSLPYIPSWLSDGLWFLLSICESYSPEPPLPGREPAGVFTMIKHSQKGLV